MSLKIFADLMSQPARAVAIFCRAASVPHELVQIRITAGENKTPEFTKMNPNQKVPALMDGDFNLSESIAMFRYLAREKDVADHWYPADSRAQARVDEYLEWQHLNTRAMCAGYFIERWLKPMTTKKFNEKSVAKAEKSMVQCLDTFERVWLMDGQKKYVAGERISVADILAACELEQPTMAGYDVTKDRPVLAKYMETVKSDLNPHYDDVSSIVYKMRDRFGGNIPGVYPVKKE